MSEDSNDSTSELNSELMAENGQKIALKAIEETLKLTTLPELAPTSLPTLEAVYGRGSLGQLKSFGGNSLAENMDRVDKAIARTRELSNVYNRNHTEWTRRHINMEYYDPWMNMRQISAEMSSRRQALDEAKYRQLENEIEIRRDQRKLERLKAKQSDILNDEVIPSSVDESETEDIDLDIMQIQIDISKKQEGMMNGMSYIEGAMKEVLILEDLYEQLKDQISDFSEVEWEAHQARAHLRMAISQSLRDVRERGGISKGEQRLLEQIGVNPGVLERELRNFVGTFERGECEDGVSELSEVDMSVNTLRVFIEETAEKLVPIANIKSEMFGFNSKPKTDYMYIDKIGVRDDSDT